MVLTEEEKKAGFWEWTNDEGEVLKFRRCPKCNEPMVAFKKAHKCGWKEEPVVNAESQSQITGNTLEMASAIVEKSMVEAKKIVERNIKIAEGYTDPNWTIAIADQIRRTEISLKLNKPV